jgi:hypothetical protein
MLWIHKFFLLCVLLVSSTGSSMFQFTLT